MQEVLQAGEVGGDEAAEAGAEVYGPGGVND